MPRRGSKPLQDEIDGIKPRSRRKCQCLRNLLLDPAPEENEDDFQRSDDTRNNTDIRHRALGLSGYDERAHGIVEMQHRADERDGDDPEQHPP
ncbi:hypothetical protein D3C71_727460 [compost metagenome]